MTDDALDTLKGDDKILAEAKKRFQRCEAWESTARKRWIDDYRFANGDSDNQYQWPSEIYTARNGAERPCLTINKTRQHNLQIINDARQNKAAISYRAVGNGATKEAAEVFEGIARHVEYISDAQSAYDTATSFQVQSGIGYIRLVTDYASDEGLEQEIFIRRVKDPLGVYLDPDIAEFDGSDARFGFVFTDLPREVVEAEYPQFKNKAPPTNSVDNDDAGWLRENHIRVCEYYRVEEKDDELYVFPDGRTARKSEMASGVAKMARDAEDEGVQRRVVTSRKVRWYKIVGDEIVDERDIPGRYVPIIRVVGEETIIEQELDRKGHTRALKDPQRMYNYWSSTAVEYGALQSKSPYIAPAAAIEGYETYWESANRVNHAILPYNHVTDEGQEIPPPQRQEPPTAAPVAIQGMEVSANEMMMVSGQYQAEMGAESNERTGVAIQQRQRQGDNATYHYINNFATAVRFLGRILLDWIPVVYDTPRVMRILAEDGEQSEVHLDPRATQAYVQHVDQIRGEVKRIFNPNVGRYDVQADVGPAFGTKREEAFNAFVQIATQAPELMQLIGDIMFRNADFPGGDEAAERLERMVPPQARGGPGPDVQALQAQLQKLQGVLTTMTQQMAEDKLKLKGKEQQKDIDVYDAETRRMSALQKSLPLDPQGLQQVIHQMVADALATHLGPVVAASAPELQQDAAPALPAPPPQPGVPQNAGQ